MSGFTCSFSFHKCRVPRKNASMRLSALRAHPVRWFKATLWKTILALESKSKILHAPHWREIQSLLRIFQRSDLLVNPLVQSETMRWQVKATIRLWFLEMLLRALRRIHQERRGLPFRCRIRHKVLPRQKQRAMCRLCLKSEQKGCWRKKSVEACWGCRASWAFYILCPSVEAPMQMPHTHTHRILENIGEH